MTRLAVMFDLDGTLADTLDDIANAANFALARLGRPAIPTPRYRYLAGQGLESLAADALGREHAALVPEFIQHFRSFYAEHDRDHTRPFPGITDLLDALTDRGLTLAVLSNKPHDATVRVVGQLLPDHRFAAVRGARPDVPLKPDPAAAFAIADDLNISPRHWMYVGDTDADMRTGAAAGMFTVGVTWGFRDEPELRRGGAHAIVHHPADLLPLLDTAAERPAPTRG